MKNAGGMVLGVVLLAALGFMMKGGQAAAQGGNPPHQLLPPPIPPVFPPGGGGYNPGGGGYKPPSTPVTPGYTTGLYIPQPDRSPVDTFEPPPGTQPEVLRAVEREIAAGTFTQMEKENLERLSAPMYYTEAQNGYAVTDFGSEAAARAALADYYTRFA